MLKKDYAKNFLTEAKQTNKLIKQRDNAFAFGMALLTIASFLVAIK